MSDDRVRRLERRFRETGAAEDEAAWLQARVRAGELAPERLLLGDHLARAAEDPLEWFLGLERWGEEALRRARLAGVAALVGLWEEEATGGDLRPLLRGLEDVVLCPCPAHVRAVGWAHEALAPLEDYSVYSRLCSPRRGRPLLDAVLSTAADFAQSPGVPGRGYPGLYRRDTSTGRFVTACLRVLESAELLAIVRREVRPWAVGDGDPLRERVERERGGEVG